MKNYNIHFFHLWIFKQMVNLIEKSKIIFFSGVLKTHQPNYVSWSQLFIYFINIYFIFNIFLSNK